MQEAIAVESSSTKNTSRIEIGPGVALLRNGSSDELQVQGQTVVAVDGCAAGANAWSLTRISAAPGVTHEQLCLALYAALRRGRVERKTVVTMDAGALRPELLEQLQATPAREPGKLAARIDVALSKLAQGFEPLLAVPAELYVQEVADTVRAHVESAFSEGFFRSVADGRLSKQQYVYILAQQHAYVRYTTRILGYCVAYSDDSALRKHFAKHLSEEVNHEKILEADLAYLGADVEYVVRDFEPNPATLQFVLGELALVSHFHDPVLLTAAPLVAEGISGHLGRAFIDRLEQLVRSWGHAEPERATRFFSSHIEYDGGDDGHFEGSMRMLHPHLTSERLLRRYLAALHSLGQCFLRIYRESMSETDIWSAGSARPQ